MVTFRNYLKQEHLQNLTLMQLVPCAIWNYVRSLSIQLTLESWGIQNVKFKKYFFSLIYFAEKEDRDKSWTFMESFWFGLMALTSVGNGEKKPNSNIGKVAIGSNEIKLLLSKQITFTSFYFYFRFNCI